MNVGPDGDRVTKSPALNRTISRIQLRTIEGLLHSESFRMASSFSSAKADRWPQAKIRRQCTGDLPLMTITNCRPVTGENTLSSRMLSGYKVQILEFTFFWIYLYGAY